MKLREASKKHTHPTFNEETCVVCGLQSFIYKDPKGFVLEYRVDFFNFSCVELRIACTAAAFFIAVLAASRREKSLMQAHSETSFIICLLLGMVFLCISSFV